jgi:microcystin-dependent protein
VEANPNAGDLATPTAQTSIARASSGSAYIADTGNKFDAMDASAFAPFSGNSQPHNNVQPYLAVTFIIALSGVSPLKP